jgi:hypothetical protein
VNRLSIITEALARYWCAQRHIDPNRWCSYTKDGKLIDTYLSWQMQEQKHKARAVLIALEQNER